MDVGSIPLDETPSMQPTYFVFSISDTKSMDSKPIHILLVEDEPSLRDNVIIALESEAMRVSWAGTGLEADRLIASEKIDLVLLDVGLPDTSGFDLCRSWRMKQVKLPILFLTARSSEVDRVVGLEIGGDDYLVKPFSLREMVARIRAVLRRAPMGLDEVNEKKGTSGVKGLVVDDVRMCVLIDGHEMELTRYEFRLMRLFLKNPSRVYSRGQLMDHVWEEPDSALERTVDAHIKQLRAKLREHGKSEEMIRTHRGLGYSFDPQS
jgi:two-component system, OmpR family, catabolic regulation response regulator CreB